MGKKDKNALLQKSPAEFFADNKNIAGFDNVRFATFNLTVIMYYSLDTCLPCYSLERVFTQPYESLWRTVWTQQKELGNCQALNSPCAPKNILKANEICIK